MNAAPTPRAPRRVIVAGGGLAGITAAIALADRGVAVHLLETRRRLGGRATSFTDPRTGETLDNCQHVALGCCSNYIALCERLGVDDLLEWTADTHWVEPGGRTTTIRPSLLPPPAHLTTGFALARFLNAAEKAAISRAMLAALRADRHAHARETFTSWLARHSQPPRAIDRFWAPIIVSACNLDPARVAASVALHVLQEGFLERRDASRIGVSRVPLVRLYDPAERIITRAGGTVRLGASVVRLDARTARLASGESLEADAVISALPFERLSRVIDDQTRAADDRFDRLDRLEHSPILGVHLTFDRPITTLPHAVLVDRPTQWIFRKDPEGRLHAVISAADDWLPLDEPAILDRVLDDLRACFPAASDARLDHARAVKERRATFAPTPLAESLRPEPTGPSGLMLAGDAVRTGWPATMEGAVRSGLTAAAIALADAPDALLAPPRRPAPLARALASL